jgi:hypothetical protein
MIGLLRYTDSCTEKRTFNVANVVDLEFCLNARPIESRATPLSVQPLMRFCTPLRSLRMRLLDILAFPIVANKHRVWLARFSSRIA